MNWPESISLSCRVPGGDLHRLADFPPTGKVPVVGKVFALLRLDRLDGTFVPVQEKAGAILPVDECQAAPVRAKSRVFLDKVILLMTQMGGDRGDFLFGDPDESRPSAAGRAALAEVGGRHRKRMNYDLRIMKA